MVCGMYVYMHVYTCCVCVWYVHVYMYVCGMYMCVVGGRGLQSEDYEVCLSVPSPLTSVLTSSPGCQLCAGPCGQSGHPPALTDGTRGWFLIRI